MNLDYSEREPLFHNEEIYSSNQNEIVQEKEEQLVNHSLKYSTFTNNSKTNAPLVEISPKTSSSSFFKNVEINNDDYQNLNQNKTFCLSKLLKFTGPGLLISTAYLDPGNLESDLQAGSIAGYKLLWVLMYSTLGGFLIQILAARLGSVTGLNLAEVCYKEYGRFTRLFLWTMIELSIIASDIQQVIGSAIAINILSQGYITLWVAILITASDVFLFLILERTGIRIVEATFALFIGIMGCSFLYMYIRAGPDQIQVIEGIFYPWCSNCTSKEINQLVAIIGSIVLPHNIYFHSSLVLSRNFDRTEFQIQEANKYFGIESGISLFLAFIINLFVTTVSAKTFSALPDNSTVNITLFNAGTLINNHYGFTALIIWAVGLLSAGQCSTITGTYAGQFIMEGFTKINLSKWKRIIITRSISIFPCVVITLLAFDSIHHLNFWCNIVKAIQLPFALLPILHFTSSKRIMGSFRTNILLRIVCYIITLCILSINVYFVVIMIIEKKKLWSYLIGIFLVIYLLFVIFFLLFRRLFCTYNAEEIDALLHTNPIYRRPEKERAKFYSIDKSSPLFNNKIGINAAATSNSNEPFSYSNTLANMTSKRNKKGAVRNIRILNNNSNESPTII